ncbi:unnamed protein product [Hymenolepis diminuta]|nr:unnamed protein product [Hymenolepis diminuta]
MGAHFNREKEGFSPEQRPIVQYINFGIIYLDKPSGPSAGQINTWIKDILHVQKTRHKRFFESNTSGCLLVGIGNATRLLKSISKSDNEYVAVLHFYGKINIRDLTNSCESLSGQIFQRPPFICRGNRDLRIRTIRTLNVLEFDDKQNLALLKISCEEYTRIHLLCNQIGLMLGVGGKMEELRRVKYGNFNEYEKLVTMYDIIDAYWMYITLKDERYLRKIILPLETLLVSHRRIIVKDSAVAALCFGAALVNSDIIYLDNDIEQGDDIVFVTSKGEAIALAVAKYSTARIVGGSTCFIAETKRVIMEKEHYRRQWTEIRKRRQAEEGTNEIAIKRFRCDWE